MSDPRARSFGSAAEDYERGRPGWPDRVADVAGLPPDAEVLDLAAGTGKLTRLLVRRFARVVAVEPDDALRELIRDAETLAGEAERIPLPDASVDGVFCAEAFHWFDAPRAVAEIARVLRPGGSVVVCFNDGAGETEPRWPDAARAVIERHRPPGEVGGRHLVEAGAWRDAFAADERFEPLAFETAPHDHLQSSEEAVAQLLSISGFALLPEAEREEMRHELRNVLPDETWRTPLLAEIWSTRRRD
ncbi:MAG TPA: class I SAM-dependent methyltransferase [Gaiellaceae bacterium]|nr:class I SAM-dependent methyltransferase [Gaiellaceae bacterium]